MKYWLILVVMIFSCLMGYVATYAGSYICPSCGKVLDYDADIKWINRTTILGNEVADAVLYCPFCHYNTERDSMGNIKLQIHDLWEYRYAAKNAISSGSGCGCIPLVKLLNPSTDYSDKDIKKISEDSKVTLGSYPKISFSDGVILFPPDYFR